MVDVNTITKRDPLKVKAHDRTNHPERRRLMYSIIGNPSAPDKTEAIARVAPYNDTIEVSSRRSYPSALLKAVAKNSGSMLLKEIRDRNDPKVIWHYLLAINQPSRYCIDLLQWYSRRVKISVYRFHLALDVFDIKPGCTRDEVIEVFAKILHLSVFRHGIRTPFSG